MTGKFLCVAVLALLAASACAQVWTLLFGAICAALQAAMVLEAACTCCHGSEAAFVYCPHAASSLVISGHYQ